MFRAFQHRPAKKEPIEPDQTKPVSRRTKKASVRKVEPAKTAMRSKRHKVVFLIVFKMRYVPYWFAEYRGGEKEKTTSIHHQHHHSKGKEVHALFVEK
jgi:hypothetical protein